MRGGFPPRSPEEGTYNNPISVNHVPGLKCQLCTSSHSGRLRLSAESATWYGRIGPVMSVPQTSNRDVRPHPLTERGYSIPASQASDHSDWSGRWPLITAEVYIVSPPPPPSGFVAP